MWAWDVVEGQYYYFKPSTKWKEASPRFAVAFGIGDDTYAWYTCIAVSGETDAYYVQSPGNYDWMILTRQNPANSTNSWDNKWTESGRVQPNSNYNRFDVKGGSSWAYDFDWKKYAPPMSSATLTSTATTYGGDGTSGNPYQIKKGTTLSVSASATSTVDGGYTKYYQFYKKEGAGSRSTWGSRTTTNTASVTASSTVGVTYEIDVVAQNEYYSTYGTGATSSKLYFITVDPIYAILGDFNSWSRSAATWDLSNQGSNNWDATFSLTKGTYEFKVVHNSVYYGKGTSTPTTITRGSSSVSSLETGNSVKNLKITADVNGSYTFRFNSSSKNLTVTFQPAYTVTYGKGTGGNTISASAPSVGGTFSSGAYVAAGDDVTFTQTNNSGYRLTGWYTASSGGSAVSGMGVNDNVLDNLSATATVYSRYAENLSSITISAGSNGSVTNANTWNLGVTTSKSTTATANPGYYFTGWSKTGNAVLSSTSTASITVKGDGTNGGSGTATANFALRYAVLGSVYGTSVAGSGMPGWSDYTKTLTYQAANDFRRTLTLKGNTKYKFRIRDLSNGNNLGGESEYNISLNGTHTTFDKTGGDVTFTTQGSGNITFQIDGFENGYPQVKILAATSPRTITFGSRSVYNGGASADNSTTGGTVAVVDGYSYSLTSGQYVENGGTAVFTATPKSGYTFAGWYSNSTCTTEIEDNDDDIEIEDNVLTLSEIGANKIVYAKFTENMTTVTIAANDRSRGTITVGGAEHTWGNTTNVGVRTNKALSVTANAGYYFAGWTKTEGTDYKLGNDADSDYNEDSKTPTLKGKGTGAASGQTLTANFLPLEIVYFRNWDQDNNRALWSRVYVYFSTSEEGWSGSGMCAKTNSSAYYKTEMTREGTSNVYWAYVPRSTTKNNDVNIAFSNTSFGTNYKFNSGEGVMRADYKSYYNTFVPQHSDTETKNGTKYYKGYWKNHNKNNGEDAGYYLKRFNGSSYEEAKGDHKFTIGDDNTIICNLRLDNTSSGYNKYMVTGAAGDVKYITSPAKDYVGPQITSSNFTDVPMQEWNAGSPYFEIIPTSEGNYVLSIDQSGDIMKLSVNYPVSVGDYRLKHSYTGKKKTNPAVDSTYYTYSDVIKLSDAASGQTISMYLSTAGTNSLVLQKCTLITAGVPQWDGGNATNLGGVLTTVGSNYGVYQFDVAVNTSTHKVSSAPTATKYTGSYYIKTDGATGGWANYKQNSMEENTLNYDTKDPGKSFNYYYCKYYSGAGSNLKCVIANDYCNALTDTLIGDAVLGLQDAKPRQTTPSAVNVRFSYNSYTNEINRSYLGSSVASDFLRILGNTTAGQPHIYAKDEGSPGDATAKEYIKFEDKQNWRYEIDVKANINARAKLTAAFNGQTQYFWGAAGDFSVANTELLFGGSGSGTYGLTLVYDFKTNKLITAWKPTGTISDDLTLNSDIILLREHQGTPTTITFGTKAGSGEYASLSEVKTVYSVLRFNRWKLSNRAHPEDLDTRHCDDGVSDYNTYHSQLEVDQDDENGKWLPQAERELYFISFPFDVKMSDIIHFGGYYNTWGIMYYDGKGRAKNGYWIDSESNWKYFTPEEFATGTLKAYEGYIIGIDLAIMAYNNTSFWTNNSSEVDIYFPSKTAVSTITQQTVTVKIDTVGYECTINRTVGGDDGDRRIKDSHWHCIGVPAYASVSQTTHTNEPDENTNWKTDDMLYVYSWRPSTNDHVIADAGTFTFNAMYAYLVQYSQPTLSWSAAAVSPSSIAARRMKTEELRDRQFNLQLLQDEKEADHTYIRLSDDEEVTTGFEFNHDVSKMMLSGANIYTLIGKEQAAANSLPLNLEQTTTVPVGVKIATNGDYTFSISEGTQGVGVTLIDNETGSRTNLSALDYEISLEAGTYNERFMLEISPIMHTPTSVESITGDESYVTNARKVMIDGLLYIVKDGVIYDARGAVVK